MRKFVILFLTAGLIVLTNYGKVKKGEGTASLLGETVRSSVANDVEGGGRTAEDVVIDYLNAMRVEVGHDAERGRIVAVSTDGYIFDDDELDDDFTFTYDFPDDASDDFETKRFKAMWRAYADGLADITKSMQKLIEEREEGGIVSSASCLLNGVVTITTAESCNTDEYVTSVAVCQSDKRAKMYSSGRPQFGKYALGEWLERKSQTGIVCPQSYCDNEGTWWRIAGVPLELGAEAAVTMMRTERAKRYAYEAALRTIAVRVSTTDTATTTIETQVNGENATIFKKLNHLVKIDPINTVLPVNPSQVRWFEFERMNPMTGKPVRCIVAALRSGSSADKPEQNAEKSGGQAQQVTAIDQAKEYLESKGWRTGREFLKTSSFAVALGGAAFKYTSSMDGAAFAQKRNAAVRQALMESAMNVAFTFGCRGDLKMSLSSGDSKMQQSYVADDEAVERIVRDGISFCDDSDVVVDLKNQGFMWRASFSSLSAESSESERKSVKKIEGRVKSEMPILGLKVERQFESIVDGVYQISFVVTCDPKRGRDMVLSFANEKSREERGKLPLGQWVEEQDFGMVAGPRQYVDDKGNVWMIGIAPAAEGCRPFGSSLDGMAREYAAFGLSGDVKASYAISSLKGSSGEYSERKAEILYRAAQSPIGKNYPKEFELVFHRAFIHPLTGRRGEVSICALRSGTRAAVEKLVAEQIKENQARAKERGRKQGIRDSLLEKGKGQFQ